jgi:hypothetical protein
LNKFNRRNNQWREAERGPERVGRREKGPTLPLCRVGAHAREAAGNQRPWPADKVERWAIDRLIPYAKNARTHSDAQIAAIAASIKEWGWTTPALVGEDGGLIAGHARILAERPRRARHRLWRRQRRPPCRPARGPGRRPHGLRGWHSAPGPMPSALHREAGWRLNLEMEPRLRAPRRRSRGRVLLGTLP